MTDINEEKFEFVNLEKTLISSFFQDRKMWVDLKDHIDPNYFNDKNVSKVFQILKIYFNRYKDFPNKEQIKYLATKKNFDKDGFKTIEEVYAKKHMELSEIDFLREETNCFIKNSKLERAILSSVDLLNKKDYNQIYDLITNAVHWNPDINLGTDYANAVKRYAVLDGLITDVVESPWESLNHFLSGGFYKKELYLFVASSSVGKSIALDQVALHAWDKLGMNVAVITFEMSEERKGQRMDACKFGIPVTEVYNEKSKVINAFENNKRKNKLFIKELPQSATTADIEQYLYQVKLYENIDIDILVVDYMDIMSPKRARVNEYLDQGTIGADLRDLAKTLGVPTISASQMGRSALNIPINELDESKIADSWKKIMIADGVIALAYTAEERKNGRINMKGLKNRNGVKDFIIKLKIKYEILKISDLSKKEKEQEEHSTTDEVEEPKKKGRKYES